MLFLAISLVSAPYWLDWFLPTLLRQYGVVYQGYENENIRSITLNAVEFAEEDYHVTIKQVTLPSPLFWAIGRFTGQLALPVELVDVNIVEKAPETGSEGTGFDITKQSAYELFNEFLSTIKDVNRWLPNMRVRALRFTDQFDFTLITWGNDIIFANGLYLPKDEYFRFRTEIFPNQNKIGGLFVLPRFRAFFEGDLIISDENLNVHGKVTWMDNVSTLDAVWDEKSLLPYELNMYSEAWILPEEWLNVPEYHQPLFSGTLVWQADTFHLDAKGVARAIDPKKAKDLNTVIKLSFSDKSLKIEELKVETPWVQSGKDAQIADNNATELNININLGQIDFINADGIIKGLILVEEARETDYPEVKINLSGTDLVYAKHAIEEFDLVSHFNWPNFALETFKLKVDRIVDAELSLAADFQTHIHSGQFKGEIDEYKQLLETKHDLKWHGTSKEIDTFSVKTTTKTGEHNIEGSANITDTHFIANIRKWSIAIFNEATDEPEAQYESRIPFTIEKAFDKDYYKTTHFKFSEEGSLSELEGNFFINELRKGHLELTLTNFPLMVAGTIVKFDPIFLPLKFTTLVAYFDLEDKVVTGKLNTEFAHPINAQKTLYGNLSLDIESDYLKAESEIFLNAEEQLVSLHSGMPVNKKFWEDVFSGRSPELTGVEGLAEASKIPIKVLRAFLPDVVKEQGTLTVNIKFSSDDQWQGSLIVEGMSTYPLMPMGPIDNIHSFISFNKQEANIQTFSGLLGSQPVVLSGRVNYKDIEKPVLDLELKGEDVPILRSPGLVLKANVDLTAKTALGKTTIAGNILLKEGFALLTFSDFKTSMGSPGSNPPYFSVKNPLVADWGLDILIEGKDFLTLDTPVLKSKFSAHLELSGTLEDPVSIGEITLDGGTIKFPFTTFTIQQGEILLNESNPYSPQLAITGTGKTYGYDITMNIGGTADDPQITFTSSPPLESGQILLMVTSGQIPQSTQQRSTSQRLGSLGLFLGSGVLKDFGGQSDLADRITIRVGEQISETGQDTINVEYKINDRFSIVGERDRYDAYNVDLLWQIYAK